MSLRDQVLFVGDSITQGYTWDWINSMRGVAGLTLLDTLAAPGGSGINAINFGRGGFTLPEYLREGRGFIAADPGSITAAVVSVWTPNGPQGETSEYATLQTTLDANKVALQAFEAFCLANSIMFIPIFYYACPYDLSADRQTRLKNAILDYAATWPHLINCNSVTQDPAVTTGYIALASTSADAVHPSRATQDSLKTYFAGDWARARAAAISAYGF